MSENNDSATVTETTDAMTKLTVSEPPPTVVRGITGEVKWFSPYVGYGFVTRDDNEKDIFVHFSAIVRSGRLYRFLSEGDKVEFDVVQGFKGPEAWSVTAPGGEVIQGSNIFRTPFRRFPLRGSTRKMNPRKPVYDKSKSEENNNSEVPTDNKTESIEKTKDAGGDKLTKGEGRRRLNSHKRNMRKMKRKNSTSESKEEAIASNEVIAIA